MKTNITLTDEMIMQLTSLYTEVNNLYLEGKHDAVIQGTMTVLGMLLDRIYSATEKGLTLPRNPVPVRMDYTSLVNILKNGYLGG